MQLPEPKVTFSANTPKADKWIRDNFGSPTVSDRFQNRKEMASEFRRKAEGAKLTVAAP